MGKEKSLLRKQEAMTGEVTLRELRALANPCKYLHWGRWILKGAPYRNREDKPEEQS